MVSAGDIGTFVRRLRGLSLVTRWNFHPRVTGETVDAHSFWVAIFAMILVDIHNEQAGFGQTVNAESVLRHALLHDAEEAITADLPFLVKREIKPHWRHVAEKAASQLFGNLEDYLIDWDGDGEQVRKIVKAADLFDVIHYANYEATLGNASFGEIRREAITLLQGMNMRCVTLLLIEVVGNELCDTPLPELMTHL